MVHGSGMNSLTIKHRFPEAPNPARVCHGHVISTAHQPLHSCARVGDVCIVIEGREGPPVSFVVSYTGRHVLGMGLLRTSSLSSKFHTTTMKQVISMSHEPLHSCARVGEVCIVIEGGECLPCPHSVVHMTTRAKYWASENRCVIV